MSSSTPFLSTENGSCEGFPLGAEMLLRRTRDLEHGCIGVVGFFIATFIGVCAGFIFGRRGYLKKTRDQQTTHPQGRINK